MAVACKATQTCNNTCVLYSVVRVVKHSTNNTHIFLQCQGNHFTQPVFADDFNIIVQQQVHFTICLCSRKVVDCREVKTTFVVKNFQVGVCLLDFTVVFKCFRFCGIIFHYQNFKVFVCSLFIKAVNTFCQHWHLVFVWDNDRNQWLAGKCIVNFICTAKFTFHSFASYTDTRQMVVQCFDGIPCNVRFCTYATAGGLCVNTPVVQYFWNMVNFHIWLFCNFQEQVVVLCTIVR